jgi:diphthamide biosynthesis enzyme Dph1/Dph2-like protein
MTWEFDLEDARKAIATHHAKKVLIQLPDGIKPYGKDIVDALKDTGAELFIWTDSNYGSCDLPVEAKNVGVDLILHFGHEQWNYMKPRGEKLVPLTPSQTKK